MSDQQTINNMRSVINQHSKTIKQLTEVVNRLNREVIGLQSVVARLSNISEMKGEGDRLDNFHKAFADALKSKK